MKSYLARSFLVRQHCDRLISPTSLQEKHMDVSSTPRRCKLLGCGGTMTLARSNQAQQWHWVCTRCGHIEIMKGWKELGHTAEQNHYTKWFCGKWYGVKIMTILRIERAVRNFDVWKKTFDSDPLGRKKLGVWCYRILRPTDNPNYVMIDLEFDG